MSEITNNPSVPTQVVAELKFPNFITSLGIIPTSYKDSMSYYECLAWLCKFLQETVIPTVNQNGLAVEELQRLYVQLNEYVTNYFTNLDVQEEINNKLDDMVEQGTLQEIIATYLNAKAVFCFENVEAMKESVNLINGSYAQTLGYYEENDGGASLYYIDENIPETYYEELESGLYAKLIVENSTIYAEQIGCYGDNTHDDSTKLNALMNMSVEKIIAPKSYKISNSITIEGNKRNIEINEIDYSGNTFAVNVHNVTNSNIKIKKVNSDNGSGIKVYGEENNSVNFNKFIFDFIDVLGTGLKIGETGLIYNNEFSIIFIKAEEYGIEAVSLANATNFNNENHFSSGRVSGNRKSSSSLTYPEYAVKIKDCGDYKFYDFCLEEIKDGYLIDHATGFSLINPRLAELPRENGKFLKAKNLTKALIVSSLAYLSDLIDVEEMEDYSSLKLIGNIADSTVGIPYNSISFNYIKRQGEVVLIIGNRSAECVKIDNVDVYLPKYKFSPARVSNDTVIKSCLSPCNYFICSGGSIQLSTNLYNALSVNEIYVEIKAKGTVITDENDNVLVDLSNYDNGFFIIKALPTYLRYAGTESKWIYENIYENNSLNEILSFYGSKNLHESTNTTIYNDNGITITPQTDKTYVVNGTATENVYYKINEHLVLNKGTYILSGAPNIENTSLALTNNADTSITYADYGTGVEFTIENDNTEFTARLRVTTGAVTSQSSFKPMIRLAKWSDNTYVPYAKTNQELSNT